MESFVEKSVEPIRIVVDADLEPLIPGYLANRRKDVEAIRQSVANGDYEPVRVAGHSMKGSGGGYGFDEISRLGAALEEAAKRSDGEAVREAVERLTAYLDRIEVTYDEGES